MGGTTQETEAEKKARLDALFLEELGLPPKKAAAAQTPAPVAKPKGVVAAAAPAAKPVPAVVNVTRTYQFAGEAVKCVLFYGAYDISVPRYDVYYLIEFLHIFHYRGASHRQGCGGCRCSKGRPYYEARVIGLFVDALSHY